LYVAVTFEYPHLVPATCENNKQIVTTFYDYFLRLDFLSVGFLSCLKNKSLWGWTSVKSWITKSAVNYSYLH